ncbi:MAG: hypothetical protein IIA60_12005, partial [Candidatus Marinimicrobia bacterium]|nr:hypothetical protein [Candidatus Neomarinimicrobiota bacterium]
EVGGAGLSGVYAQIILPGEPLGTFFGHKFEGYDDAGNEILSSEGGPLEDGRQILGNAQPSFTFGISNTINRKNIDFRFFIQGVQGIDILNNTRLEYQRPANLITNINMFGDVVDDVADGLGQNAGVTYTDRFIEDGSFIRLQNITLGYTFNTDRVNKLRVYLSADNLLLLTKYKGYDPEVNTFIGQAIGIDYTNYPKARTITVGLNIGL